MDQSEQNLAEDNRLGESWVWYCQSAAEAPLRVFVPHGKVEEVADPHLQG